MLRDKQYINRNIIERRSTNRQTKARKQAFLWCFPWFNICSSGAPREGEGEGRKQDDELQLGSISVTVGSGRSTTALWNQRPAEFFLQTREREREREKVERSEGKIIYWFNETFLACREMEVSSLERRRLEICKFCK